MLNSAIVTNINGDVAPGEKISRGLNSALLRSDVEFAVTEVQSNASNEQKFLQQIAGKSASNIVLNGHHGKGMNFLDNNRNPQAKTAHVINGNKNNVELTKEEGPSPKVFIYIGRIHSEWQEHHKIGAGLTNLGNTCFMNTVLQCLTYCPPLANYLLHDSKHTEKCKITGFCMMCELHRHMNRVIDRSGEIVKPVHIYHKLKTIAKNFQFGRQEDAHEFLRYVIDNMWKSCLVNYEGHTKLDAASKETTVINKIFGGYHRSQVTCLRCHKKTSTYDHFMDFILDVKQNVLTLEKALEKFIQPELLQNENAYKCVHCKAKVSAQKKFTIFDPPNVATFQFKRFDYNRICGGKITKHISYPEVLNLRPYMSNTKGGPIWYRLNAVLVHLGATCNSGHYYCFVRSSYGVWFIMDDTRVQQVSVNQVLNQVAYVLFYIRTNPSENSVAKRPAESSSSMLKNNLKNGFIGSVSCSMSSNSFSHSSLTVKSSLPTISKLTVSSPHNVVVNKTANTPPQKQVQQNLLSNHRKISFGINSPKNIHKLSNSAPAAVMNRESPLSQGLTNNNILVPYIEDSSGSSGDESKVSDEKFTVSSNINGNVSLAESVKCASNNNFIKDKKTVNRKLLSEGKSQSKSGNFLNEYTKNSAEVKKPHSPLTTRSTLNYSPVELKYKNQKSTEDNANDKAETIIGAQNNLNSEICHVNKNTQNSESISNHDNTSTSSQLNSYAIPHTSSNEEALSSKSLIVKSNTVQKENIQKSQENKKEESVCDENDTSEICNLHSTSKELTQGKTSSSSDVRLLEGVKKKVKEKNQIFLVQDRKSFLNQSFQSQKTHSFRVKSAQTAFTNNRKTPETEKQNSIKRRFGDALENSSEKRASGLPNNYENSCGSVSKKPKTLGYQDKGSKYMNSDEALDRSYNSDIVVASTSKSSNRDKFYSNYKETNNRTDVTLKDNISKNLSHIDNSYSIQIGNRSWTSESNKFKYEDRRSSLSGNSLSEEHVPLQKIAVYVDSDSESKNSSRSSWEYEWVEKTKESIETEKATSDVRPFNKFNRGNLDTVSNHDVIAELQKHSSHIYDGTRDNIRRNNLPPHNNRKYNYNDYDESLDKGKVRKKKKYQFQRGRGQNPFDDFRNRHKISFHNKWRYKKFRHNQQWKRSYGNRSQNGYGHFHRMHKYPYFHRR